MSEVHAALTRALDGARALVFGLDLDTTHRFIILSDTHKGGRDRADEFERCEPACTAALRAYRDLGFSLILPRRHRGAVGAGVPQSRTQLRRADAARAEIRRRPLLPRLGQPR